MFNLACDIFFFQTKNNNLLFIDDKPSCCFQNQSTYKLDEKLNIYSIWASVSPQWKKKLPDEDAVKHWTKKM